MQANPDSIKFYAYMSSAWVELDDAGAAGTCRGSWGIPDNSPLSRVAMPGELIISLNNSTGLYTPGGPSALAGFQKGLPFKMVITFEGMEYPFYYYISEIDPRPSTKDKKCDVTAVTWLDYADRHPIVNPGVLTNKRGDEVLTTAISEVEIQPQATDLDTGIETFPTVFDTTTSHTTVVSEMDKVAFSELGYIYERHNGTIVFEAQDARPGSRTVDALPLANDDSGLCLNEDGDFALNEDGGFVINDELAAMTFDGSIIENFDAPYGKHQINRMTVYAYPRRIDASVQVLFQLDEEIVIGSGQSYTLKGTWADPNGGLPINAQEWVTPVATTDYTMYTATGGGGSDITGSLTISWTPGTEGFTAVLTNGNAATGYLNKFSPRAKGIYYYNQISHTASNSASITEYEAESETLHQKYQNTTYTGRVFADSVVAEHKDPRTVLNSITFPANRSPACMMAFLNGEVGQLHYIDIDELNLTGNYYIQGIEFQMNGRIITVTWIVAVALSITTGCGLTPVAVEFGGGGAADAVNFGYVPRVANLSQRTWSAWIWNDATPTGTSDIFFGINSAGAAASLSVTTSAEVQYYVKTGGTGIWKTPVSSVPTGQWVFVVVSRDASSNPLSDPLMYINATAQTVNVADAMEDPANSEIGAPLIVGNLDTYDRAWDGKIFDPRIYNRILTAAEVTQLYNAGTPDASVGPTSGLVFQAFAVRTEDAAAFAGKTLTSDDVIFDNQFKAVGVVHGAPIGRAAP